ncbi:hypothetical protein QTH47_13245 [Clostridium perfringens]|uniref:hypothetical protein n=1 Tax=Clostridium perfringens TaxID=1502 RepID=UPI0013E392EA|nr:hypothetical protein [Clostridium perfringens]MBO3398503.1 hypothetical protein [Clostridium perfringens]MDM0660084.1 hypothetical protein [Clostridium perfringens]NGS95674.1 hypothetical protein [Clostridium perfringens]
MNDNIQKFEADVYEYMNSIDFLTSKRIYKTVKNELIKKKLTPFIFNEVMNEENGLNISDLETNEQIAIAKGLYNYGLEKFKPSNYFNINELGAYETYIDINENNDMELIFENVKEYNDYYYCCTYWKPSEQYRARKNRLVRYNFATQRQANIRKTAYGTIRREINLNRKSVNGIKEMIKAGEYFPPDTLTLNILLLEEKNANVHYNKEKEELRIKINYDIDATDYTVVDFTDGWHRDTAIYELYNEGFDVEKTFKGFPVNISIVKPEVAARFVNRQMLANRESDEYMRAMEKNSYNDFIEAVNKNSKSILFNQIAKTREEMLKTDKLTYNEVFEKALRHIEKNEDITIEGRSMMIYGTEKYVDIINTIFEILEDKKVDNKIMKVFKSENIWLGYFAIWSYLQKNKLNDIEEYKLIDNFVENVIATKDEDIKDLKLNNKAFNIGNTYNFFRGLI